MKLRRLAKVIENLKSTDQRILDAALDYGFSSHANFTRAFKETYGITPESYRRDLPMLNTFARPEVSMKLCFSRRGGSAGGGKYRPGNILQAALFKIFRIGCRMVLLRENSRQENTSFAESEQKILRIW